MEANIDLENKIFKAEPLFTSQSLMLIFSFLDIKSINLCKLMNKIWHDQVNKYFQHKELTLYKELFSHNINKNLELSDAETNEISLLLLQCSKAAILIQEKLKNEVIPGKRLRSFIPHHRPGSLVFSLFYAFVVFI